MNFTTFKMGVKEAPQIQQIDVSGFVRCESAKPRTCLSYQQYPPLCSNGARTGSGENEGG